MISTRSEWDKSGIPSFRLESLRKYFDQYFVATCSYKFSHHVKGDHSFIHTEDLLFKKASTMPNSLENYNGNDPELLRLRDEMRAEFAKENEELERKRERIEQLEREVKERQERLRQLEEENRMKREERKD